jgi:NAD(P)-dependent dehydrogenase (short-subunit alcohol dehydrogenase family)
MHQGGASTIMNLKKAVVTTAAGVAVASCVSAAAITFGAVAAYRKYKASRQRRHLAGEVALVTGGSRGLGFAVARELLGAGCRVAICARDEKELRNAAAMLGPNKADLLTVVCDVSDRNAVQQMVQQVESWAGHVDILVNNAGEISVGPLENADIEDFERAMAVMFWGVLYPSFAVLDGMKQRGHGRIANITSIGGKVSIPHLRPYCCAKFAAVGFSEGLGAEVARHGIRVTTIAPGLMRTGSHLQAKFKGNQQAEATWFSLAATTPAVSMSAERAARQIVDAIERGVSEKILTTQANILARVNGAAPEAVAKLLSLASRLLPEGTSDGNKTRTGAELRPEQDDWLHAFTALGQRAAKRLNQFGSAAAASNESAG